MSRKVHGDLHGRKIFADGLRDYKLFLKFKTIIESKKNFTE